jgi:hypothetical protein
MLPRGGVDRDRSALAKAAGCERTRSFEFGTADHLLLRAAMASGPLDAAEARNDKKRFHRR